MFDEFHDEILQLQCILHAKYTFSTIEYTRISSNIHSIPGERGTKICGYDRHHQCLEFARKSLANKLRIKMNCDLNSLEDRQIECNCLPRCNEITYDYDYSISDIKNFYNYYKPELYY
jgi:hypothetical protein